MATWEAQETFLQYFSESASVGAACIASRVAVGTVDSWGSRDTHGFKKRKALAGELFLGRVEAEINRRAIEGVDHPVIHQGVITDTYKQYSDNLLMFRAKRLDPEYRDSHQPTVDLGAREALEAMTRAVVQFNATNLQVNINVESGSEEKPAASIMDMI